MVGAYEIVKQTGPGDGRRLGSGNTASTAIPLALDMLILQNRTQLGSGHQVLLYGAASGFSIGYLRVTLYLFRSGIFGARRI